jgi:hypothetical protein
VLAISVAPGPTRGPHDSRAVCSRFPPQRAVAGPGPPGGGAVLLTLSPEIDERRGRRGLRDPSRLDRIAPPAIRAPFVPDFLRCALSRDRGRRGQRLFS